MTDSIKINRILSNGCVKFFNDLDTLYKYYSLSKKSILLSYKQKKEKYRHAFSIAEQLDELTKTALEEKEEKISDILNGPLCGEKKVSDVISEISFDGPQLSYVLNRTIKNSECFDPNNAHEISNEYSYLIKISKSSMLMNAVVIFEQYLSFLYGNLIRISKEKYFENKTILLRDVLTDSIDSLLESEIDKIVECDTYDCFLLIDKIFQKEKISSDYAKSTIEDFREIYYRRNIYVHNDGFANLQYLSKVPNSSYKDGEYLKCDDKYISKIILTIKKLIFFISFAKISKLKITIDDFNELSDYLFDCLKNKEYDFCIFAYRYLAGCKNLDNADKMVAKVNLIISLKESKDFENFNSELQNFDVSGAEDIFVMAKLILEQKFQEAATIIESNYNSATTPNSLMEWPLFKEFRDTKYYSEIKNSHIDDFSFIEIKQE